MSSYYYHTYAYVINTLLEAIVQIYIARAAQLKLNPLK